MASPYHIFRFLTKSVSLQCCKYFASFASLAFRILHHHKKEKPVPAIAYATHHLLMSFTSTGCKLLARLSRIVFHNDCIRHGGNRMSFECKVRITRRLRRLPKGRREPAFSDKCTICPTLIEALFQAKHSLALGKT